MGNEFSHWVLCRMKQKVRSFMVARFREMAKGRKILKVTHGEGGIVDVQFEGKVTVRLNNMEAQVFKKDLDIKPEIKSGPFKETPAKEGKK